MAIAQGEILADQTLSLSPQEYRHCLLLITGNPAPQVVQRFHRTLNERISVRLHAAGVKSTAQLYLPSQLHVTVATLQPRRAGIQQNMSELAKVWSSLLSPILCDRSSSPQLRLRLREAAVFNDGVGVLLWDDVAGRLQTYRQKLRSVAGTPEVGEIIQKAGGLVNNLRIPDIIHSTVLRWHTAPQVSVVQIRKIFMDAFAEVKSGDVYMDLNHLHLVEENLPCLASATCHYEFYI